ncbi:flavodoxin family protein [Methanomicrobium antiquum]|uniref:Flavodoxin family protein n=1 Tax=Methanomicrobium antiquum TaxID=487686 RepID=A0AAF0FY92_9EURY|nr:flavodoxin family protein [Methanomicrobium antiquum]MDD3976763.1 flavodoxin family protein [Methanomicrobium sp.]WFN36874.1 flavodoxin family protein [Methanomicrobium antiquum]
MTCQIIALMGSPIPDGNCGKLLEKAISGAKDAGCNVVRVDVPSLKFSPCMEHFYCEKNEGCMINDDFSPFLKRFKGADGFIVAMPVMTMGVPGALKSFMDRFQVYFMAKYVRHMPVITKEQKKWRKTLLLSIGGMNIPNDFDGIKLTMDAFCDIIDAPLYGEVLQNDMDNIKDITTRPEVLQAAYDTAFEMCSAIITDKDKYQPLNE